MKLIIVLVSCAVLRFGYGQQCSCVQSKSSSNCLGYDSRIQAATLDEAVASFPDLTLPDPVQDKDPNCLTSECQLCREQLKQRLMQVGMTNLVLDDTIDGISSNQVQNSSLVCTKYQFAKDEAHEDVSFGSSEEMTTKHPCKECPPRGKRAIPRTTRRRGRQATSTTTTTQSPAEIVLGTRYKISCSVKGVTTDSTGTVALCSSCWVWRKLPDNYSPQYVNELICDTSDTACLSGFANCVVGSRAIDVVRNDTGTLTPITINAGTYCECRCTTNSVLSTLVTGTPTDAQAASVINQLG